MVLITPEIAFDFDLIQKYDTPAPRYTSYPPATEFTDEFTALDFQLAIASSNQRQSPLSLYFHLPFCQSACYFCGCNVIVTNNKKLSETYLEYLQQEIYNTSRLLDTTRPVSQLHWGGGTPNYLSLEQVESLWKTIQRYFKFTDDAEISIEVNPRLMTKDYIFELRSLGFNRISFGIQDFNPEVQEAVNRVQPEKMLFEAMEWIKTAGFESVNVDLIYGLPFQTLQTFETTIEKTIELDPDRIAIFNFAYVPGIKPVQKNIPVFALPSARQKLEIWQMAIDELTHQGYVFIGMDHFAKPEDELAIAQRQGKLKRNFQGYTTQPNTDLYGFGLTSISMLQDAYVQNHKQLKDYYQAVESCQLPVSKGVNLTWSDILRRDVIMQIMSNFKLDKFQIECQYQIDFDRYFCAELAAMQPLEADGLVQLYRDRIEVTPLGRLLVRNIAVLFDAYTQSLGRKQLSKTI